MVVARWIFWLAGIYGLLVIAPLYFLEGQVGSDHPAGLTHPEFFYGFVGVTLAWQVVFLMIGSDPIRYRPLMIVAALLEKFPYTIAVLILWGQSRLAPAALVFAGIDAILGILFLVSFSLTPASDEQLP